MVSALCDLPAILMLGLGSVAFLGGERMVEKSLGNDSRHNLEIYTISE
jgi:hypothetical protein